MADGTEISWTNATWNVITGCMIKSPGCTNCYAQRLAGMRLRNHPSRRGLTQMTKAGPVWTGEVRFNEQWLDQPLHWRRPRDIFVIAHGDIAYEAVPDAWIARIFNVMAACPQHRFQVLTKRIDRLAGLLRGPKPHDEWHPKLWHRSTLPNVWIGVSVERQQEADERRDSLQRIAAIGWNTWVSYEPALGPIDWRDWGFLRWMVSGGESGPRARPSHPDWHRSTRDFCVGAGIPFFFKQWGEWSPYAHGDYPTATLGGGITAYTVLRVGKKAAGAVLDGREWRQMPEPCHG